MAQQPDTLDAKRAPRLATRNDPPASTSAAATQPARRVSEMAEGMMGSAILKVAADVRALAAQGRRICNLTVGDFDSRQFPVPGMLRSGIEEALRNGETNYPPGFGLPVLREAIRTFSRVGLALEYPAESVLVTSGARPAIYAAYRTLVDPGERVVYSVPSWNNAYYCQLVGAEGVSVACDASTSFQPTRAALEPVIRNARMLVLNSPLNPTGTVLDEATLGSICDLVLEENARRAGRDRPLYLLYDQVYWMLTFGSVRHVTPVALRPAMAPYTVSVDAISKSFAATGLRVGWILGPTDLISRMGDFIGHVGAWAPRPEQVATAALLTAPERIAEYHLTMKQGLQERLDRLYQGIIGMRTQGLPVDAVPPAGAIYLSARFALAGRRTPGGQSLRGNEEIRTYLLQEASFAAVPFQAFGVSEDTGWFRLSAGAVSLPDIDAVLPKVAAAVEAVAGR
jgi:aspartate aminotransferase